VDSFIEQVSSSSTFATQKLDLKAPMLSNYLDYRHFLKDFYQFKRKTESTITRAYSYAMFSAAADIKSPNYLKLVIDRERNLSDSMAEKFAKAAGLQKVEIEEFKTMVKYGQAQDPTERSQWLKVLEEIRIQKKITSGEINTKTLDAIQGWLSWILLQMVDQKGVDFSPQNLASLIRGNVNSEMVKKALEGLYTSGALEKSADSLTHVKVKKVSETAENFPVDLVRKIQSEFILLALESLFRDSAVEREFGTLTVSLTKEEFEKVKFELRHLRKRLLRDFAALRETSKGDRVYQLNIQLFPVTEATPRDS
jgi:uncharacterized protein (TIGR02147 family)